MFTKILIDEMDKKDMHHHHHHHNQQMVSKSLYGLRMGVQEKSSTNVGSAVQRIESTRKNSLSSYQRRQYYNDKQVMMTSGTQPSVSATHHHHQHSVLPQTSVDLTDKLAKINRRNANKEINAMELKNAQAVDKNEEALTELQKSIPEINKIFDVHCRIGSGTFSSVLLGTLQRERCLSETQRRRFAIKHHNPTNHPERILRELECMFRIGGVDNVIGINCCIRYNENVAFVLPYMTHDRFHDIYRSLSLQEIRDYLRNLLIALRHVHKFNVIHRDVKPSNILFNRRTGKFLLCDFGLAQRIAADGSIMTSNELSSPEGFSFLRDMENGRRLMLPDGNSAQAEDDDFMALRRMRASGGGGVDYNPAGPPCIQKLREQAGVHLTKRDVANQRADTLRLLNRLRLMGPNVDPNNYVIAANSLKKDTHASRAGTPGYRPPEVLLRYPHQTTAVDIWAAGVIMLSLLSAVHPFFKAPHDCAALAEIINLFGDMPVRKTAFMLDRLILLAQKVNTLDLRRVCMRFRHADFFLAPEIHRKYRRPDGSTEMCRSCEQPTFNCLCHNSGHHLENYDGLDMFPANAYDLLSRLLEVNPQKRITAEEALKHPFFGDQHRITPGVPLHQQQHVLQHQQHLRPRETLPSAAARTLKAFVSYPIELVTTASQAAGNV
ncbi:cell division cycle 7-related protein kinase [Drosophila ficusphila]|uniref:cell division cycle 7-related protein kinase n=1 Tax=Drosophila ficusphila TaxID=30025 RepID=UPI0007E89BD0|nr:cell division cycle 7-related protein kinase [Drosophila ficusphila]